MHACKSFLPRTFLELLLNKLQLILIQVSKDILQCNSIFSSELFQAHMPTNLFHAWALAIPLDKNFYLFMFTRHAERIDKSSPIFCFKFVFWCLYKFLRFAHLTFTRKNSDCWQNYRWEDESFVNKTKLWFWSEEVWAFNSILNCNFCVISMAVDDS